MVVALAVERILVEFIDPFDKVRRRRARRRRRTRFLVYRLRLRLFLCGIRGTKTGNNILHGKFGAGNDWVGEEEECRIGGTHEQRRKHESEESRISARDTEKGTNTLVGSGTSTIRGEVFAGGENIDGIKSARGSGSEQTQRRYRRNARQGISAVVHHESELDLGTTITARVDRW